MIVPNLAGLKELFDIENIAPVANVSPVNWNDPFLVLCRWIRGGDWCV